MLPSPSSTVTVVIDGYTHNSTITSGDSVPFGIQLILVCQVVGLPYGTQQRYTWTCPKDTVCAGAGHSKKVHNKHKLTINTISTSDGGTYTCWITIAGGQKANGSFSLSVTGTCVCLVLYYSSNGAGTSLVLHTHSGGRVVHSNGRLIPHQFPITQLQHTSYLVRVGVTGYRVTCFASSGTPRPSFYSPNGTLDTGGVTQRQHRHSVTLDVNSTIDTFQNRDMYCDDTEANYFYLYLASSNNSE